MHDGTIHRLEALCGAAARDLSATSAGVTLMSEDGSRGIVAFHGRSSQELEELQVTYGEGPCLDAFTARRAVLEPDLTTGGRWPLYSPAAVAHGVCAVFAFPLQLGRARFGVLDIYRAAPGPLSSAALRRAGQHAAAVAHTLLWLRATDTPGAKAIAAVEDALGYRYELFQAQGMVAVQLDVSLEEAMVRIRAHAYTYDLPLHELARDLVGRQIHLDGDSATDGFERRS